MNFNDIRRATKIPVYYQKIPGLLVQQVFGIKALQRSSGITSTTINHFLNQITHTRI